MNQVSRWAKCGATMFAMSISLVISGCSPFLESRYAAPRGASINGISSFVDLLRQSGRKVDLWPGLSSRMAQKHGTVIIFHNGFDRLPEEHDWDLQFLMQRGSIERMIVVVRDSDMSIDYWRQIRDQSESDSQVAANAGRAYATRQTSFVAEASAEFESKADEWYGLKRVDRSQDPLVKLVQCQTPSDSFSIEARWPLHRRLIPTAEAEVLWSTSDEPLLTSEEMDPGELLVLASATPLLNGGLVDPGNRRLAAELVRWIPESERIAIAVSSDWIDDSELESPGLFPFLRVHPNGWVFGQGIVALLFFCWWKFPILGRPRQSVSSETARFGRHVDALGKLLRRSRDLDYARQKIRQWHGIAKPPASSDSTTD